MALAQKYRDMAETILKGRRELPTAHMEEFDIEFPIALRLGRVIAYGMITGLSVGGKATLHFGSEGIKKWLSLYNNDNNVTVEYARTEVAKHVDNLAYNV